ncbi:MULTISPECIES: Pycsar system effector family protein [unclassified Neorhizobium]|uniref:Pycsar system effector family protein n=1 Tax=unclassified Neorhizobium TaxID=2629175 RepID=UPI000DD66924|nr:MULTISPECIES: Pycsar system effector family protein [unclassified Neorhizobium]
MSDFDSAPTEMLEMPMATGEVTEEYFNHVRKINDVYYDQIKISDQKAAYIFTFMLAFLVSSAEGRSVFNLTRYMQGEWAEIILSAALALASVFSILSAILVVLPRRVEKSTSLFWGTWPNHRPLFEQAAQRSDVGYLFNEYLDNADVLSLIATQKYKFVSYAFRGLMFTVLAYVLLLLVSQNAN